MSDIPPPTDFDITASNTKDTVKTVLDAKYTDAGKWAMYAATVLESKLTSINSAAEDFDISTFITAAETAIASIPDAGTLDAISWTEPTAPTYDPVGHFTDPGTPTWLDVTYAEPTPVTLGDVVYNAPAMDTLEAVVYNAPTLGNMDAVAYNAPTMGTIDPVTYTAPALRGTIKDIPVPTQYTAGAAPSTEAVFDNPDFTDALLDPLRTKLMADLTTGSTGLGDAEAGLFSRAVQRENDILAEAYQGITTNFSSRGFDMPPGALNALQAQESNKSVIRLTDVNTGIMAESARLAQSWNQTTVTASTGMLDMLARVFDSKVNRNFEAAKNSVMLALEGFKAEVSVVVSNAQLEGQYIGAIGSANDSIIKAFTSEVGAESTRMSAITEKNKGVVSQFSAEVGGAVAELQAITDKNKNIITQFTAEVGAETSRIGSVAEKNKAIVSQYAAEVSGAVAEVGALAEKNKALISQFAAEVSGATAKVGAAAEGNKALSAQYTANIQGQIAELSSTADSNKAKASEFSARASAEGSYVSAQGQRNSAQAAGFEVASRKALGVAELAKSFALSNIDTATRKYLGEIQVLQSAAQSQAQMVAAALNGVSVSSNLGWSGTTSVTSNESITQGSTYPQTPGTPPPVTLT